MLGNVSERAETQGGPGEVKRQGHAIVCDQGRISDVSQPLRSWRGGKAIDRRVALHTVRHRQAWTPRPIGMKRSCRRQTIDKLLSGPSIAAPHTRRRLRKMERGEISSVHSPDRRFFPDVPISTGPLVPLQQAEAKTYRLRCACTAAKRLNSRLEAQQ